MSRMKKANALFAASALLFAVAFYWRLSHEGTAASCLYFLTQSAFIGCAADWFATAALFRRPLGIPFHTALIPRNRARIIASVRRAAETRLLRPGTWDFFFTNFSASERLSTFLETETGRGALAKLSDFADKEILANIFAARATIAEKTASDMRDAAPAAASSLRVMFLSEETSEKLLLRLLQAGAARAESAETKRRVAEFLKTFTEAQKENPLVAMAIAMGETMGVIDYDDMAEALCRSLRDKIETMREADAAAFLEISAHFREVLQALWETEAGQDVLKCAAIETAQNFTLEERIEKILSAFCVTETARRAFSALLREAIWGGVQKFLQDKERATRFDAAARALFISVARREEHFAGETIEAALSGYDEARLNRFIYSRTAEELGSIRINGAIVAALAGGLLYAAMVLLRG